MLRGFEIGATTWILDFTSKMGPGVGLPHPQGVTPDQKYWAWSTYPMGGSNHPSFVKIGDIDFRQVFVSCMEILLIEPFKMKISSYIIWLDKSTYKDLGQNALIQNASKILTVQLFESFSIVDISSNHEKNKVIFSSIPDINMFISLFAKYNVKA